MMATERTPTCGLPARRARRGGHTLVETIIVLSMLTVIAGIALPRINYSAMRLDANVRVVRSVLQQAWRTAIQKQHDILVSMDVATGRIRVLEDADNDGQPTAGERVRWRPLEEGAGFGVPPSGVNGPVTQPVSGSGVRTVSSMPTIIFRRNGSTSGDVEIYITATYRGVAEYRGVTVAQATGRTEWFRRVNSAWWRSGGI